MAACCSFSKVSSLLSSRTRLRRSFSSFLFLFLIDFLLFESLLFLALFIGCGDLLSSSSRVRSFSSFSLASCSWRSAFAAISRSTGTLPSLWLAARALQHGLRLSLDSCSRRIRPTTFAAAFSSTAALDAPPQRLEPVPSLLLAVLGFLFFFAACSRRSASSARACAFSLASFSRRSISAIRAADFASSARPLLKPYDELLYVFALLLLFRPVFERLFELQTHVAVVALLLVFGFQCFFLCFWASASINVCSVLLKESALELL